MVVTGLLLHPRETESVFSRGKESSTLSSGEGGEGSEPTASASSGEDSQYYSLEEDEHEHAQEDHRHHEDDEYQGHFLIHPSNQQEPTMIPFGRRDEPPSSANLPKPPRHPGHFSFQDVGRQKRQEDVQVHERHQQQRRIVRTNPFDSTPTTNPFDTDSKEGSNEYSNSILETTPPRSGSGKGANPFDTPQTARAVSPHSTNPFDSPQMNRAVSPHSMNPFDENSSADYVEASYPPRGGGDREAMQVDASLQDQTSVVEEQRQHSIRSHSWDSDRQFPILEIERIKSKTKKLRGAPSPMSAEYDDGFGGKPVFPQHPRSPSAATKTTASVTTNLTSGADRSTAAVSRNTVALSRAPTTVQSNWVPIRSATPPAVPVTRAPTPPSQTRSIRRNRYFPANDSLADVLDQPTVQTADTHSTGQRSKTSQEAEIELLQSFKKPGRPRQQRSRSQSTASSRSRRALERALDYDEKKDDEMAAAPRSAAPRYYPTSPSTVNLPPPEDAPDCVEHDDVGNIIINSSNNNNNGHNNSHNDSTHKRRQPSPLKYRVGNNAALETSRDSTTATEESARTPTPQDLTLHDLCAEATNADDLAWRNALCLVSNQPQLAAVVDPNAEQFTPLHVCCLGPEAPPSFIILALLYAHPAATRTPDAGGRLPLHLAAASSADITTLELLVNEYPAAVSHADHVGMTPLHLYLKRRSSSARSDDLPPYDPECVRILLGLTSKAVSMDDGPAPLTASHILFRRRAHVDLSGPEVSRRVLERPRPVTRFTRVDHEAAIAHYPPEIQVSLRRVARWHTKQRGTPSSPSPNDSDWKLDNDEDDLSDDESEDANDISPAAIATPMTLQLPIHLVIHRILQQQEQEEMEFTDDAEIESSPLDLGQKSSSEDEDDEDEEAEFIQNKDAEQPPRSTKSPLSHPKIMDVMRLIIESFPEGLSMRDGDGYTPLLMVLCSASQELPNLDVVCLLLGRRTPSTDLDWSVDKDLPLHSMPSGVSSGSTWLTPAMVPASWTQQLPLHIVAEEFLSELPLVQAIYEAYPAAIQVQDGQGQTPLHLALSSYRNIAVDPRVMNMLYSETVAQTQDRKGQVPLDIMLDNAQVLPDGIPWAWKLAEANDPAVGTVYQRFFHSSLLHLASSTSSPGAGREILHDLQLLPQWMRRQACVSTFVQELLIEEVSTPWKCAFIMLDGILLIGLLTVFRLQMNEYIVTGSYLATWYTFAVYAFAGARFLFLGAQATLASSLGQYNDSVMRNLWYWVDYTGMILAIVTSILFNGSVNEDTLLSMGTGATGFLWWSVIGYVSRWSFAMSVFSGILSQLAQYLAYVLFAFAAVVLAFGQMLYTVFQTDCEGAIASSSVCSVRDAYRVIYLLLRGESLADETGETTMSAQAIAMVATFFFFSLVVAVGLLAIVVLVAGQADVDELARKSYWEPMLAYVMSMNTAGFCGRAKRRTCGDAMSSKLGVAWDALTFQYTGQAASKSKTWFVRPLYSWSLAILSVLVIPLWLALGLVTLGFLWPPQVRRALFRPATLWHRRRSVVRSSETTSQQLHGLRSETTKFKVLTYDRMMSVEKELRELKELLSMALREE